MNKGLLDRDNPVSGLHPEDTEVTGRVCGAIAQIDIRQVYKNNSNNAIDAAYIFPVPDSALVTDFHASMGKAEVNGFVMEREEARQAYGKTAGATEGTLLPGEGRQDIPGVALGMIPPGERVCIHISYIQQLEYYGNQLRISVPALTAPDGYGILPEECSQSREENFSKTRLVIWMALHRRAVSFQSPSHAIKVDRPEEYKAVISLQGEYTGLDRDFVLLCTFREEESSRGTAYCTGSNGGTLYMTLVPWLPDAEGAGARDYIFLLDTSDTMTGQRLAMAKAAFNTMLRNLSEIDTFRIAAFGSDVHTFAGSSSLPYAQASLDRASRWISALTPEGRADMFKALRYALPPGNNGKSIIMLLTAGRIEDSDDLVNYVKHNIGKNRVHVFGADTRANLCMLKRIADVGRGSCQVLRQGESMEDGAIRMFCGITGTVAERVGLDWTGIEAEDVFVSGLINVRHLEPITVLARFPGPLEGKALLRGNTDGGIFHLALDASDIEQDNRWGFIEKIWAKKKIEHLEGVLAYTAPEKYERVREEIIRLSKNHNIPTAFTCFVAVKVVPDRLTGLPVPRMLPVFQPAGEVYNDGEGQGNKADDIERQSTGGKAEPLTRSEILRMLARNQQANGAFYAGTADSLLAKLNTTALALIAFTAVREGTNIYRRQLEKSVKYLIERVTNGRITPERRENTQTLLRTILALKLCLESGVIKQTEEEWVLRWIDDIREGAEASLALTGGQSELLDFLDGDIQWQCRHTIKGIAAINDSPSILKKRIALSACEGDAVPALARLGVLEALKR
ncbi:MAG: VIT and vWA domain-containing protein [Clostridia bacterium]|jgi:Ca-activated chloride channel family protein